MKSFLTLGPELLLSGLDSAARRQAIVRDDHLSVGRQDLEDFKTVKPDHKVLGSYFVAFYETA